jgi:hypothetical protein
MTTASITTQVSQSLDIHGYFSSPVTLNDVLFLKYLPYPVHIVTVQIIAIHVKWKIYFIKNLSSRGQPNTVYVS